MSEQVHKSKTTHSQPEEVTAEAKDVKDEKLDQETDDILDEIDSVLEENSEEFVRSYVQKGGQ